MAPSEEIERLKAWRDAHGMTQAALAERLGVTTQTVRNWESARSSGVPGPVWVALRAIESDLKRERKGKG